MTTFHIVREADTVQGIATAYGVSPEVLRRINELGVGSRLSPGQRLYLNEQDVLGVRTLFLDVDRNPIQGLAYLVEFCGRVIRGTTGEDGLTKEIFTERPRDEVKILIARLDGSIKLVATVKSGSRNKLVTILTPRYRADGRTELDVRVKPGDIPQATVVRAPIYKPGQQRLPTTNKVQLGPHVAATATADTRPLIKVNGDIPDLDLFLDKYDGRELSDADIRAAAAQLKCEPGLIYAVAQQESGKSSFIKIAGRSVPTILFERHCFRRYSSSAKPNPYELAYPDICGPAYKRLSTRNQRMLDASFSGDDLYGPGGIHQYRRLLKAYQLNPAAALMACSWGKFQIMGFLFKESGFSDVFAFARAMSRNEVEHLKAFLNLARRKKEMSHALQHRDFEGIAAAHNGDAWRKINPDYAVNLKRFYNEYAQADK